MKRSLDQAFLDLRHHIARWAQAEARPGLYIFVYPPEWEAQALARVPGFAQECAAAGWNVEVIDIGQGFLEDIERRKGMVDRLAALESEGQQRLQSDLGVLAERYLTRALRADPAPTTAARLFVNTGALASFASYSAILSAIPGDAIPVPTVLAFPGEWDERSLNLLGLRTDTNYRIPRI